MVIYWFILYQDLNMSYIKMSCCSLTSSINCGRKCSIPVKSYFCFYNYSWQCDILDLLSSGYGIINMQILTKLKEHLINFLETNYFKKLNPNKIVLLSNRTIKNSLFHTKFSMKQLLVIIENLLVLTAISSR